jgi:hypothetical protein
MRTMATLDPELLARIEALDPDILRAAEEVDRSLIAAALERSPLERVAFASQLIATLSGFRRGRAAHQ